MKAKTRFVEEKEGVNYALGHKKYFFLMAIYFLAFLGQSCYTPYINVYYKSVGLQGSVIGLLGSVLPIVVIIIQPFWSKKGDQTRQQHKLLALFCLGVGLSVFLYTLKTTAPMYALITVIFGFFYVTIASTLDVLSLVLCERYGFRFSDFRLSATISYALGGLVFSSVIPRKIELTFVITGIVFLTAAFLAIIMPRITVDAVGDSAELLEKLPVKKRAKTSIFKNKKIVVLVMFLISMYMQNIFSASYLGILFEEIGAPAKWLGYSVFLTCMMEIPIVFIIDKLSARFDKLALMQFAGILAIIKVFISSTGNFYLIIIAQLLQGISYMTHFYSAIMFMNEALPAHQRSQGQGVISIAQTGVAHISASLLGGFLYQYAGIKSAHFIVGIITTVLYALAFIYLAKIKRSEKVNT